MKSIPEQIELIRKSGAFDQSWYLDRYPDVATLGIDPAEHYFRVGARLGRDPGPGFSTGYYLEVNQDVAEAGINPLVHYIRFGSREARKSIRKQLVPADFMANSVDVVVPVFNALEHVQRCLESLVAVDSGCRLRAIVVNDASDAETTTWLRDFSRANADVVLIEHAANRGYTCAVNTGLRASRAAYVVTLNSDTIVTPGWLLGLVRCINSDKRIGIVGPLSNAASWQNAPELYDASGHFAVNDLPEGMSPRMMAEVVGSASNRAFPRLPFVNGFCFMIRREVLNAIGYMDEEGFPSGYGEENDFCMRAADAGFDLAIADDVFVYHAKSKSFGHERRKLLSAQGSETIKRKHGAARFAELVGRVKQTEELDEVRLRIQAALSRVGQEAAPIHPLAMKVLFILPVRGGGGGAHSVVQEVLQMRRMGLEAKVAVRRARVDEFVSQYSEVAGIESVFVGFESDEDLIALAEDFDIAVATIYSSMRLVNSIFRAHPHVLPAYYVQDYEPFFFEEGTKEWHISHDSYALVPGALLFAKTRWIIDKVKELHGVHLEKVSPSLDHETYRPGRRPDDNRVHIAAMIRPSTPRRGAERTMRVFGQLAQRHPGRFQFHLFGCNDSDPDFLALPRNFPHRNHGPLTRPQVSAVLGSSDIFVDLSDYQAFGRTGIEAMACGCAVMITRHGGTDEYAIDRVNAMLVDSYDEHTCVERLEEIAGHLPLLTLMQSEGLRTASRYSVQAAAVSELEVMAKALARHRHTHPLPDKPRLLLIPSRTRDGGRPTGSAHVRLLAPYASPAIRRDWAVRILPPGELPRPGAAEAVVIQRDAFGISLADLDGWADSWRACGSRIIYEIDDDLLDGEALAVRGFSGDTRELAERVKWLCRTADIVTVSTAPLAKRLQPFNSNIRVVPNRLSAKLWRLGARRDHSAGRHPRQHDVVRIGYIGTPTHGEDLAMVADAMRRLELEFGRAIEVEVIGGYEHVRPAFGKRVGLPNKNEYPDFVSWLQARVHWDIGIIPLAPNPFNHSKSYIKFLEYAALNMAIVCSDRTAYRPVAEDGVNCLVVGDDTESWYLALRRLIVDAVLRERLADAATAMLARGHLIENEAPEYASVLAPGNENALIEPQRESIE